MGRKCSVYNCKSGYDGEAVTVYKFPDDEKERQQWISCIPNKFTRVTKYMGICALHWPSDTPLVRKKGGRYPTPSMPPSLFPNVPGSSVPTHTTCTPRSTMKSSSSARNPAYDELSTFRENDLLKKDTFVEDFQQKFSTDGLISCGNELVVLQSTSRTGCVHSFSCYVTLVYTNDVFSISYEMFHNLKRIYHPSVKNTLKYWSELEEVIRFLRNYSESDDDKKLHFLLQSFRRYNCPKNSRVYSLDDFSLAFSWYSMSRSLYVELRKYLSLPSISTLKRITQVTKNKDDDVLFSSIFNQLEPRSRGCILIIDEVHVKASLSYRGGTVFGYAEDYPEKLASTLLCIMVKCFFGSKSFLVKLIPCYALKALFQFNCIIEVLKTLENCGAEVVGLMCDNNRVNQRFFSMFDTPDSTRPWIVNSPVSSSRPLFLIYDPVHIIKNIRNNWLTETTKTLKFFDDNGTPMTACWSDLKLLYDFESAHLLKLSTLTKTAVEPNNIERQKMPLALQVFSAKTSSALKTVDLPSDTMLHTSSFIDKVVMLWKVFNTKTRWQSIHQRDPDREVVISSDSANSNPQIQILNTWTSFARSLEPLNNQYRRQQCFTSDTAKAIQWTCQSLIAVSNFLLCVDAPYKHEYITFGFFQQDAIEHHFAHFRMAAGNTFYITAEDAINTHYIDKTKLMIGAEKDHIDYSQAGHSCELCQKPLTDDELLLIDDLSNNDHTISSAEKMSLLYIAGYVCQKHKEVTELQGDVSLYPSDIVLYTENLDRGGLLFPSQNLFQLICLMYSFFTQVNERCCRRRLLKIFSDFPSIYHLDIEMPKGSLSRIINIFFKRYCKDREEENSTSTSVKNKKRKIAKLSSSSLSTIIVNL